jgi:hypothetical protein
MSIVLCQIQKLLIFMFFEKGKKFINLIKSIETAATRKHLETGCKPVPAQKLQLLTCFPKAKALDSIINH